MVSTNSRTLVLASSSPRRQQLIRTLGFPVVIRPSDVDETVPDGWEPERIVEELSLRKASAAADRLGDEVPDGLVVGSDTIVVAGGQVLGKPKDEADAERMLAVLQGTSHQVYSGVACIDAGSGRKLVGHRRTVVTMRPLTPEQIRRYIATGEPRDKAGAYAIQGLGATIVTSIEGDYFNVVGLPLSLLADLLESFGLPVI